MGFIRFVLPSLDPDSGVASGVFELAYSLQGHPRVKQQHRARLKELTTWFDEHLAAPDRFNRTRSKGHYRRVTRGIAWFKDSAHEHVQQLFQLRGVLEEIGYSVHLICDARVGYVIYEDEHQVIAEPFRDTRTGPD